MWLLKHGDNHKITLAGPFDSGSTIPPYAILSHTWGFEEVTFQDLRDGTGVDKRGWLKIEFCVEQARRDGLDYSWVDTCCIDKTNSTELQRSINSMFRWYRAAERCYVYLSDVRHDRWREALPQSRWFTRGWTLQELLAPKSVEFFTSERNRLGSKRDLEQDLQTITNIPLSALRGDDLSQFGVEERLKWLNGRKTTLPEDEAYCLLGIFDIFMPVIYGETKENAMRRLVKKVHSSRRGVPAPNTVFRWHPAAEKPISNPAYTPDGMFEPDLVFAECGGDLVIVHRFKNPSKGWQQRSYLSWALPMGYSLCWETWDQDGGITSMNRKIILGPEGAQQSLPSIAALDDRLMAVWLTKSSLHYSICHDNSPSQQWSTPSTINLPEYISNSLPVLASCNMNGSALVFGLWKGVVPDRKVYLSSYDGHRWDSPRSLPFVETNVAPALTVHSGKLIVMWKIFSGHKLYWMRFDMGGNPLNEEPYEVCWRGVTDLRPSLAQVEGTVYAAWRGTGLSADMWLSSWRGEEKRFEPAQLIPNSKASRAPILASWGKLLMLAWRDEGQMLWRCGSAE